MIIRRLDRPTGNRELIVERSVDGMPVSDPSSAPPRL